MKFVWTHKVAKHKNWHFFQTQWNIKNNEIQTLNLIKNMYILNKNAYILYICMNVFIHKTKYKIHTRTHTYIGICSQKK